MTMLYGTLIGVAGAEIGSLFMWIFRQIGRFTAQVDHHPVRLALVGGLALGGIALISPAATGATTLFWGEQQIVEMLAHGEAAWQSPTPHVIALLLALAALKMLAIAVTLHCGYRGGFIFPLFFVGAAIGLAVTAATHGAIAPVVAVLCLMAAVNVAVTKTPVATAIILSTLSGTSMLPVIAAVCVTSFILTTRIHLIAAQRPRRSPAATLPSASADALADGQTP